MSEITNHSDELLASSHQKPKRRRFGRIILLVILSFLGLCLLLAAVSTISNIVSPVTAEAPDHLTQLDKARLVEALHLQHTLGGQVFSGWDKADIPIILFNQEYIFLAGYPNPPDGWIKIPSGSKMGKPWEQVPDQDLLGQPGYRQKYEEPDANTQAFTVQIGNRWAASMGTYDYMKVSFVDGFKEIIPPPLNFILPYRMLFNLFLPPDMYIGAILHESVHAYQGIRAAERLKEAERFYIEFSDTYPLDDEKFIANWQTELDLLANGMLAKSDEEAASLAREFLDQRAKRRDAAGLSTELIAVERTREWEEGLAKYGELSIMLAAAKSPDYQPVAEMSLDRAFNVYRGAEQKWKQEIQQIRRMAGDDGDGRFYYSGFAQAALLDRLSPGWKDLIFDDDIYLEDLLAQAVNHQTP